MKKVNNKKNNKFANQVEKKLVENYDIKPEFEEEMTDNNEVQMESSVEVISNLDESKSNEYILNEIGSHESIEKELEVSKGNSFKDKLVNVIDVIKKGYGTAKQFFKKAYNKKIIYMYIIDAFVLTMIIEMLARHSVTEGLYFFVVYPYTIICNAMIILMTLSITLLMRRRIFGMCVIDAIWLFAGITNSVLLVCRVTPFTGTDIKLIDSAIGVINKYFSWTALIGVIFLVTVVIAMLIFIWKRIPKVDHKINIPRNIMGICLIYVICMGTINMGVGSGLLSLKFGNLRDCYGQYGFVYCFVNSLINTGISKPNDYSDEKINNLKQESADEEKTPDVEDIVKGKRPNIIFLQLESFFDVNHMKDLTYSEDPVPFFTELKEKYPHGFLNVPIVGAGTVNTEFEAMTSMNLDDFGPGEYPFKTCIVDRTCESICFNLKNYGYKCHAVHNNTATFYGRNNVFANLGYDTFTSIENMKMPVEDRTQMGWAKDKYLTNYIMSALKSTKEKDYIYTISVQGHGSYPSDEAEYNITVDGIDDESRKYSFEYYMMQINEMDTFVKELTQKLSEYKEDVILVLYGDHLPSLGISEEELDNGDVYQTEYIIWSNYKSDYTNEDIEAYELQPKILQDLNMNSGYINSYSQKHRNDDDQETYLDGLKNLEYDMLYGDHLLFEGKNPFVATDIQFGLKKVVLTSISKMNDSDNTIYIYGKNFTSYSKVYINGEKQGTTFVDSSTLTIDYEDLKAGDVFKVQQQNSDKHVLNVTDQLIFESEDIEQKDTDNSNTNKDKTDKNKNKNNKDKAEKETTTAKTKDK